MESNILSFIIDHFGCFKTDNDRRVLNSIGTMSIVTIEELSGFPGNTETYFSIKQTDNSSEIVLFIHDNVRQTIEKELGLKE